MRGLAALAVSAACAAAVVLHPVSAEAGALQYVALGDSYTAAPLVPDPDPKAPGLCSRSTNNYPHLVGKAKGYFLTDVSCSGATVQDFTREQASGIAPQLDAVESYTDLVTVGIGGNDNGLFASVISGCGSVALLVLTGSTAPCRKTYETKFKQWIASDAVNIRTALKQIHAKAPRAKVLVVGYPSLVPKDLLGKAQCPLGGVPFTPDDLDFLDEIERALNGMLEQAAKDTGSIYVDTYTPSLGHDMCRLPGTRWIEPLIPLNPAAPVHPNADGQAATALAVESHLR